MFKITSTSNLILYSEMENCWNHLSAMQQQYVETGTGSNCQVLGVSGVGKSTLLKNYAQANPARSDASGVTKPVVYFPFPSAPTPRTVMGAISLAFGGSEAGSAVALMKRAVHYVKHFRVEVLCGDEAHHMIDRGRMKTHAHLGDCWKEFNDQVSCCLVLAGAPRLVQLFETNNQLRNRSGENLPLRPIPYDQYEIPLAQFILAAICGGPLNQHRAFLTSSEVLTRIQFATDGVPAHVIRLLNELSKFAHATEIDMHTMSAAWHPLASPRLPPARHPFSSQFNFERLCGLGEPFYPSPFDGDNHAPYF
jgi:hypothetical protein